MKKENEHSVIKQKKKERLYFSLINIIMLHTCTVPGLYDVFIYNDLFVLMISLRVFFPHFFHHFSTYLRINVYGRQKKFAEGPHENKL